MTRGTLFIFAKAPRAGAVKTRLGAEIGMGRAAALFRIMLARTVAEAEKGAWDTIIAIDPGAALQGYPHLFPPRLRQIAQGPGNLGDRMKCVFRTASPGPVVIIGADAPVMRTRHLQNAFDALRGADAVFGPASDGGYWLIGLAQRRAAPTIFEGVRWSSAHAYADTRASLPPSFDVREIDMLNDIDEADDLIHLGSRSTAH